MPRTQAQINADDNLEAAIQRCIIAYRDGDSRSGLLGDWIVVAVETTFVAGAGDDDLDFYSILTNGGGLPFYKSVGLLEAGRRYLDIAQDSE